MVAGITFKNLRYIYDRGTEALKRISFQVKDGEFVVVMGPNGAGKTTLLLTTNGIIPHSIGGLMYGRVYIDSMDTSKHKIYELATKVGIVLQNPETQLFMPSVESELAFGPENLAVPREEIAERIKWALKITRLEGMENRSPHNLSGGQKQVVAIASVLTMRPEILVLDEPTSQLDPYGTNMVFSTVRELNKKYGITILMAEHKSEHIAEFADRIIILDKGKIVYEGTPHDAFSKYELFRELKIKLPQVSEVAHLLKQKGIMDPNEPTFITLDEAEKWFRENVNKKYEVDATELEKRQDKAKKKEYGDVVIDVRNLHFVYPGGVEALRGIDLKIREGEFVAIIGQNGAGKSTLVKTMTGVLKPYPKPKKIKPDTSYGEGEVIVMGMNTLDVTVGEMSRYIGLVLQNPDHQLFSTTVYDEIAFGPKNHGLKKEEIDERVKYACELIGIPDEFLDKHPLSLSWGDRQKVAIAAILSMKPKILILDEPTTGEDYLGRHQVVSMAKKLNEEINETIIMISHDIDLVAEYADRTIVMGLGKILLDDVTSEVFTHMDVLNQTYLNPPQISMLAQRLSDIGFPPTILTIKDFMSVIKPK